MNPVPFTWMLMAFAILFGAGGVSGGTVVYKWWGYSVLKADNARLKLDNRRFREALGFSTEIDDESIKVEIGNDEILEAILRKAPQATVVKRTWLQRVCPTPAAAEPNPVCVDADGMRHIGRLK